MKSSEIAEIEKRIEVTIAGYESQIAGCDIILKQYKKEKRAARRTKEDTTELDLRRERYNSERQIYVQCVADIDSIIDWIYDTTEDV